MVDNSSEGPKKEKRKYEAKGEMRKIPIPPHRYSPLKENWIKILTPLVKNLHLQVRYVTDSL